MVKDLVPFMRSRLESERNAIQQHLLSRGVFMDKDTELQTDFDTLFKQLFCVAAQDLADELRQPLQDLGTLYDEILATTLSKSSLPKMIRRRQRHAKGQVIFTVRQLSRQEASRMAASGFRFSSVEHVTTVLSRRIHVSLADLNHHLKDMRDYATTGRNFDPGVHLISFVMRPTVHDHFEVLTARGTGNPLPSSTLPISRLQMHHLTLVSRMDGWPIRKCINYLETEAAQDGAPVDDFRRQLSEAMSSLSTTLPPDTIATAALCPRLLLAPCRPSTSPSPSTPPDEPRCFLLAFCALGTLDTQPATPPTQTFTPLRLFRAQQQVNDGATSHRDVFSKELNQDLFYSSNVKSVSRDPDPYPNSRSHSHNSPSSPTRPTIRLWPRRHSSTGALSSVSQESLVDKDPASASVNPFAEIMVHKEVKVDVAKISDVSVPSTPVKRSSSSRTTATHSNTAFGGGAGAGAGGGGGGGDLVPSTYVDELYSFCHSHGVRVRSDRNLPPGSSGALWGEGEGGGRSWA